MHGVLANNLGGAVSGNGVPGGKLLPFHEVGHLPVPARQQPADAAVREREAVAAKATLPLDAEQERLLIEHLPMVRFVARGIHERLPQHVELEELVGAGTLGLVDAVRRFDRDKSVQFRSYAQFRVRGAILDSLRTLDWSPRELRRKGRVLAETSRALQAQLRRPPVEGELAAAMGMSLLGLQELVCELKGLEIGSLHEERGEDSGEEELAFLPAKESENPLLQLLDGEARERLAAAVTKLPERERLVMTLYYFEERSMREIGALLGVVESRVSQVHHMALGRLRGEMADLCSQGRTRSAKSRAVAPRGVGVAARRAS